MSKVNFEFPKFSVIDDLGNPLDGGKVFFYESGTSTLKNTYADAEGTVVNANPVILDSRGEADIFLDRDPYKIIVKDKNDVTIFTRDDYQAYMEADDSYAEDLLINADARVNKNGYVSGTAVVAGDDIFDTWACAADGSVTFAAGSDITLSTGCKITHTNDDISAVNGETATIFVESGSVTVSGLGISAPTLVSQNNPLTFVIDTSAGDLVLGSAGTETYSGVHLVLSTAIVSTARRPFLLEKLLCKDYTADIDQNTADHVRNLSGHGVISRTRWIHVRTGSVDIAGGAYRVTGTNYDKIVRISATTITVNIDYDIGGTAWPPWGSAAYMYIRELTDPTVDELTTAAEFRLCPEWVPTYVPEKNGWYYGNNRCIGVFFLDTSSHAIIVCYYGGNGLITIYPPSSSSAFRSLLLNLSASTATGSLAIPAGMTQWQLHCYCEVEPTKRVNFYVDSDSTFSYTNGAYMAVNGYGSGLLYAVNYTCYEVSLRNRSTLYSWAYSDGSGTASIQVKGYMWDENI